MDFYQVPIGFGMTIYSAMTEEQKQEVLNRAHKARSETEMHQIVDGIAENERVK